MSSPTEFTTILPSYQEYHGKRRSRDRDLSNPTTSSAALSFASGSHNSVEQLRGRPTVTNESHMQIVPEKRALNTETLHDMPVVDQTVEHSAVDVSQTTVASFSASDVPLSFADPFNGQPTLSNTVIRASISDHSHVQQRHRLDSLPI